MADALTGRWTYDTPAGRDVDAQADAFAEPVEWTRWGRVLLAAALYAMCFSVVEHDPVFANMTISGIAEEKIRDLYIDQIEDGNAMRQVVLLAFGAAGAGLLLAAGRRANLRWGVAGPLFALIALAIVSCAWSGQPGVSARRIVVLMCLLAGGAGLARFLRPRELMTTALVTLLGFIAASYAVDLALGGRPWKGGDYRFGGTLHPNAQAAYCGVMCLACLCQPIGLGGKWLLRGLFVFGAGTIVLTQSRTGLLSLVLASAFVWVVRLPALFRWAGLSLLATAAAGAFVAWYSVGDGVRASVVEAALLGRQEQSKSLTGRVPLWEELVEYAGKRPLVGYGYEGFWTPDQIAAIMKSQNWTLQNAHNSYFEIVLQFGLVGFVIALALLFGALRAFQSAYDATREPAYAFLAGVLFFAMANSMLESLFVKLRLPPMILLTGILSVALFYPVATSLESRATSDERADRSEPRAA